MTPKDVVRAWGMAFNRQDAAALAELYAEDATNYQVPEEPVVGKAAIRAMFEEGFRAFPDMGFEEVNLFEDGEWAILEWKGWSTNLGPVGDHPPTGRKCEDMRGCGFFQVRDGKIVFQRGYWDKLTFLRKHGLPVG